MPGPPEAVQHCFNPSRNVSDETFLRILDAEGEELWRWSDDYAFIQVLGEERLASGESRAWRERYGERVPPGDYTAKGVVPATDRTLEAEASFRVRSR